MNKIWGICLIALSFGCGSGASGSVNGTLLGKTVKVVDAASYPSSGTTVIVLADVSGVCSDLTKNSATPNANVISFLLTGTPGTGTFTVAATSGQVAEAQFAEFDATCASPNGESTSAGTVTITASSSSAIVGTFDLTFGSDHVTGSFNAPNCAGAVVNHTTQATCN